METSGCVKKDIIREIAPHVDLFLYDIKHIDPDEHKKYCGMGNETILENLQTLSCMGKEIIIRMVVIPGVNDAPGTLERLYCSDRPLKTSIKRNTAILKKP